MKNNTKKNIIALSVSILILGALTGCSGNIDETKQNNTETQQTQTGQQDQTNQQDNTIQNDTSKNSNDQNTSSNSSTNPNVKITQEEAAKLALDRVSGSTEQDIRIELDYDNGSYKYEGEIIYNQKEYEFEIDANTGTFLEWSEETR